MRMRGKFDGSIEYSKLLCNGYQSMVCIAHKQFHPKQFRPGLHFKASGAMGTILRRFAGAAGRQDKVFHAAPMCGCHTRASLHLGRFDLPHLPFHHGILTKKALTVLAHGLNMTPPLGRCCFHQASGTFLDTASGSSGNQRLRHQIARWHTGKALQNAKTCQELQSCGHEKGSKGLLLLR